MKYWADNGGKGGPPGEIKFSEAVYEYWTYTFRFFAAAVDHWLLNNVYCPPAIDYFSQAATFRGDVWTSINLSTRECKEDWFSTKKGMENRVE